MLSGLYEDDQDNSEDIIYTGQGGNDLLGKKHQVKDQEMSRGNLALKVSYMKLFLISLLVTLHGLSLAYMGFGVNVTLAILVM